MLLPAYCLSYINRFYDSIVTSIQIIPYEVVSCDILAGAEGL